MPAHLTDVRERAKLRVNEENRAKRAFDSLEALVSKHLSDQRVSELNALEALLLHAIRNQHLIEPIRERKDKEFTKGDF